MTFYGKTAVGIVRTGGETVTGSIRLADQGICGSRIIRSPVVYQLVERHTGIAVRFLCGMQVISRFG